MKRLLVKHQQSLKEFLAQSIGISKNRAKELIDSRNVFINNRRVWIATHTLKPGDVVELSFVEDERDVEPKVIYEDSYIIAVNKPPFLLSDKSKESLEEILRQRYRNKDIKAIHRLDMETSGVIIFGKNYSVYQSFKQMWEDRSILKTYLAISHNESQFSTKMINSQIDGKEAISKVKLIKKGSGFSYFEVQIETGRKHQIRRHLSSIRHPIVGDKIYGIKKVEIPFLKSVRRHMLHAYKLQFIHPFTGERISLKAQVPSDFMGVLHYLK